MQKLWGPLRESGDPVTWRLRHNNSRLGWHNLWVVPVLNRRSERGSLSSLSSGRHAKRASGYATLRTFCSFQGETWGLSTHLSKKQTNPRESLTSLCKAAEESAILNLEFEELYMKWRLKTSLREPNNRSASRDTNTAMILRLSSATEVY